MKTAKMIIGLVTFVWIAILIYITFISENTYINALLFFGGALVTMLGASYGFDKIENEQNKK